MHTLSNPHIKRINNTKELVAIKASQLPSYLAQQSADKVANGQLNGPGGSKGQVFSSLKVDLEKLTQKLNDFQKYKVSA